MANAQRIGEFEHNCCEIELSEADRATFALDHASILLELRPSSDLYGVFYTAKGNQWDVWSDHAEEEERRGVAYAMKDPGKAAMELLKRPWRPDFEYNPDEDG